MQRSTLLRALCVPAAAAALLAGCVVSFGESSSDIFGHSVVRNGSTLRVDGVTLPFERWVPLNADLAGVTTLEVASSSGEITLTGAEGTTTALTAHLYSEVEGDGEAVVENGRVVGRSSSGSKVFIDGVKGTIPAGLALKSMSGTGDIRLEKLVKGGKLECTNGTGSITLVGCGSGTVKLETGTGNLRLTDCSAPGLSIETGTGDATLERCKADRLEMNSGTGDLSLVQCEVGTLQAASGTGDATLDGGQLERVSFESGTGRLVQRNEVRIGSLEQR